MAKSKTEYYDSEGEWAFDQFMVAFLDDAVECIKGIKAERENCVVEDGVIKYSSKYAIFRDELNFLAHVTDFKVHVDNETEST
jgi:hypothetical protein